MNVDLNYLPDHCIYHSTYPIMTESRNKWYKKDSSAN